MKRFVVLLAVLALLAPLGCGGVLHADMKPVRVELYEADEVAALPRREVTVFSCKAWLVFSLGRWSGPCEVQGEEISSEGSTVVKAGIGALMDGALAFFGRGPVEREKPEE